MRHRHIAALHRPDPDRLGHVNHARALSPFEDDERAFWTAYQEDTS